MQLNEKHIYEHYELRYYALEVAIGAINALKDIDCRKHGLKRSQVNFTIQKFIRIVDICGHEMTEESKPEFEIVK